MCVCLLAFVGKKSWYKFGRFCLPCKVILWVCVCVSLASLGNKSWYKFGRFCLPCKVLPWVCVCVSWPLWEKNLGTNLVGFVFIVKFFHGYVCVSFNLCG